MIMDLIKKILPATSKYFSFHFVNLFLILSITVHHISYFLEFPQLTSQIIEL